MRFVLNLKSVACLPLVVASTRLLGVLRLGFEETWHWTEQEKVRVKRMRPGMFGWSWRWLITVGFRTFGVLKDWGTLFLGTKNISCTVLGAAVFRLRWCSNLGASQGFQITMLDH
jgi:hypothetical protein